MGKISALPEITTTITDGGYVPVVQDGTTYKINVGNLKGKFYVRATWYEAISTTTGTVTIVPNGEFVEDNWREGIDILTTELDSNGYPSIQIPENNQGIAITATLVTNNVNSFSYQLSGTPTSPTIGLIYCYRTYNTTFDESKSLEEITLEHDLKEVHNEIRGIQGGDETNRFHVTSTIHNIISTLSDGSDTLLYKGVTIGIKPTDNLVGSNWKFGLDGNGDLSFEYLDGVTWIPKFKVTKD